MTTQKQLKSYSMDWVYLLPWPNWSLEGKVSMIKFVRYVASLELWQKNIKYCLLIFFRGSNVFEIRMADDPTQLISTFTHTELVGIVSLMYGMLLHSGATSRYVQDCNSLALYQVYFVKYRVSEIIYILLIVALFSFWPTFGVFLLF